MMTTKYADGAFMDHAQYIWCLGASIVDTGGGAVLEHPLKALVNNWAIFTTPIDKWNARDRFSF